MNFYDELRKIMIALAQIEVDSAIISVNVCAGKHMYRISSQLEVEEIDHEKGEDATEEKKGE